MEPTLIPYETIQYYEGQPIIAKSEKTEAPAMLVSEGGETRICFLIALTKEDLEFMKEDNSFWLIFHGDSVPVFAFARSNVHLQVENVKENPT